MTPTPNHTTQTNRHRSADQDSPKELASISIKALTPPDAVRIGEIDRSERIKVSYNYRDGQLLAEEVDWDVPDFYPEGDGEHTLKRQVDGLREPLLKDGGVLYGALDGDRVVGLAALRYDLRPGMDQLLYLMVSNGYRRRGIANRLAKELLRAARERGTERLYVTATPSESAVGFYVQLGFRPTDEPLAELLEEEPDDIHMTMAL